jgi:hypothetical protein
MTCTLHVAWDEQLADYHFGPDHPLGPVRVELTMRLADEFGLWNQPGVTLAPRPGGRRLQDRTRLQSWAHGARDVYVRSNANPDQRTTHPAELSRSRAPPPGPGRRDLWRRQQAL